MLTCGEPEAARDSLDRPQAVAAVEDCGSLDHRVLLVGEAPQRGLGNVRRRGLTLVAPAEDAGEAERPPTSRTSDCGPDRAALAHPAVAQRRLLAELADLDELADPIRGEAIRPLAEQERALAHGAAVDLHDPDRPHEGRTI